MKSFSYFILEQEQASLKIQHFLDFASKHLGLSKSPTITLVPKREPGMTTAYYSIGTGEIKVNTKGRAFFDICRSIAHEMVHQKQHQEIDDPSNLDGSTGSPHEDEANAVAGRIVRLYGSENPEFYE